MTVSRLQFTRGTRRTTKVPTFVQLLSLLLLYISSSNNHHIRHYGANANFLRDGFSSKVGSDAKSRMKLDDAGAAAGMSREMYLMKDRQWELKPPVTGFASIPDMTLRRHCEAFFNKPITMKLSQKQGKYGLRAVGELSNGKRLRGFWRSAGGGGGGSSSGSDFLKIGYDEAIKQRLTTVEFELQLPRASKKAKGGLPSVIYSIAMEPGAMNPKAVVPRGGGNVRILPKGHADGGEAITIDVGKAYVSIPMRSGLVDPGWAKGRAIFRRGRPTGTV